MGKRLLAILGSPHKNGATGSMLQYATDIAGERGWEVEFIHLYDKKIVYCTGCRACINTRNCVQQDDIQKIAKALQECNMVILASPVYWANVPAAVKNLFDRLLGIAMEETRTFPKPRLSKKQKFLLFIACNTQAPFSEIFGQSTGATRAIKEFFQTSGMKYGGKCVWTGKNKKQMPKRIKKKIERLL